MLLQPQRNELVESLFNGAKRNEEAIPLMLDKVGLSLPELAENLSNLIKYSDKDNVKLSAIELSLRLHGALLENIEPGELQKQISLILHGGAAQPEKVNAMLNPAQERTREREKVVSIEKQA